MRKIESVMVTDDIWFRDFKPWSGAVQTWQNIMDAGKDDMMDDYLNELYPEGLTRSQLNDLLWFDKDSVYEYLGMYDYIESGCHGKSKKDKKKTIKSGIEYDYGTPEYKEWMAKRDAAEDNCLNEAYAALPELYNLINSKLGLSLQWNAQIKSGRTNGDYIRISSENLDNTSGILPYLFKEINLETFNSSVGTKKVGAYPGSYDMSKDPECYYWMTVDFSYTHPRGGSNGCDFATCRYDNGHWTAEFIDER